MQCAHCILHVAAEMFNVHYTLHISLTLLGLNSTLGTSSAQPFRETQVLTSSVCSECSEINQHVDVGVVAQGLYMFIECRYIYGGGSCICYFRVADTTIQFQQSSNKVAQTDVIHSTTAISHYRCHYNQIPSLRLANSITHTDHVIQL
jgi:hypothetical protein